MRRQWKIASVTLGVTLLALELGTRLWVPTPLVPGQIPTPRITQPSSNHELPFELKPGARDVVHYPELGRWRAFDVSYEVNAAGFRDVLIPFAKAPGHVRVLLVGDSLTMGTGVPLEHTLSRQLEAILRADVGSERIEVMNFGVLGFNTRQEVELLLTRGIEYQPDIAVVCFYMNDVVPSEIDAEGTPVGADWIRRLGLTVGPPSDDSPWQQRLQWALRRSHLVDLAATGLRASLRAGAFERFLESNWGVPGTRGWDEVRASLKLARASFGGGGIAPAPVSESLNARRRVSVEAAARADSRNVRRARHRVPRCATRGLGPSAGIALGACSGPASQWTSSRAGRAVPRERTA
ncbi:MAG: hypothetical protein IT453_01200 [Planctomycetes bacterium]|nr:hypothetical protein [Planctomycetota bacterium]